MRRVWPSSILAFQKLYHTWTILHMEPVVPLLSDRQTYTLHRNDRVLFSKKELTIPLSQPTTPAYTNSKSYHSRLSVHNIINHLLKYSYLWYCIHQWWNRSSHQSVYVCTCLGGGSVPVESVDVRESSITSQSQLHHLHHLHLLEQLL